MPDVTHPSEGIYLSKFMAGISATLLAAAMIGSFTNLWYLNAKAIEFQNHVDSALLPSATLPGALSRAEWVIERRLITQQLQSINTKLDDLKEDLKGD